MSDKTEYVYPKARMWADSFVYIALALLSLLVAAGIDFGPYFEAKRDVAIMKMQVEVEQMKATNGEGNKLILERLDELERKLDARMKVLEAQSHPPGENQ